jgi:Negative regulator of sigma F
VNTPRDELIRALSRDLQAVRPPPEPLAMATGWWLATWLFVVTVTITAAALRPGAAQQLWESPHFLLESLTGLLAGWLIALAAFRSSIPGDGQRGLLSAGMGLGLIWLLSYVVGLEFPALAASMAGKRADCFLETLVYALPPALLGRWLCGRYMPLAPARTTALIAVSGAMVPALFMQLACMYGPEHILTHHILPIPAVVATLLAGDWLWRAIRWR